MEARLRVAGVRSSPRRVRRVMGREPLACAPIASGATKKKTHDGTIVTDKVNEMWGTDMSQTVTIEEEGGPMFSSPSNTRTQKSSAFTPRVSANRFEARWSRSGRGCIGASGSIAPGVARGLKLRHDHGSNYMSGDFQSEIKCLGHRSFAILRARTRRAKWRRRALHPNLEGELALGADVQNHRGTARRATVAFARRYNETWLRRAAWMQKRPRGSEEEQTMPPIAIDPTLAAALPLAAWNKRSRVSQNRAALHVCSRSVMNPGSVSG